MVNPFHTLSLTDYFIHLRLHNDLEYWHIYFDHDVDLFLLDLLPVTVGFIACYNFVILLHIIELDNLDTWRSQANMGRRNLTASGRMSDEK